MAVKFNFRMVEKSMAGNVTYKVITGKVAEIEKRINELATHGWRVVSSAHLFTATLAVILEHPSTTANP
jgi:hypothetical protein